MFHKLVSLEEVEASVKDKPIYLAYERYVIPDGWFPLSDLENALDGKNWYLINLLRSDGYVSSVRGKSFNLTEKYYSGIHEDGLWFCTAPIIAWQWGIDITRINTPRYTVHKQDELGMYDIYDEMLNIKPVVNLTSKQLAMKMADALNDGDREAEEIYGRPVCGRW
jgi:hypothetical protein